MKFLSHTILGAAAVAILTSAPAVSAAEPAQPAGAAKPAEKAKPPSKARVRALVKAAAGCKQLHRVTCPQLAELIGFGEPAGALLMDALGKRTPAAQQAAIVAALGAIGHTAAGPAALERIDAEDGVLRRAAILATGQLHPDGAPAALARRLGSDDIADRQLAASALGLVRSTGSAAPLMRALKEDTNPAVRAAAARSLGALGQTEVVMDLARLLAEPETPNLVRAAISQALGRLKSADAVPMLIIATGHGDDKVARAAIGALARIGDPRAAGPVSVALRRTALTEEAAGALGLIKDPVAIDELLAALKQRDLPPQALRKVFWALGEIHQRSVVPAVKPHLKSEDPKVAVWAAAALGELSDARASDALVQALRRDEQEVRDMAGWALEQIWHQKMGTDADMWQRWLQSRDNMSRAREDH